MPPVKASSTATTMTTAKLVGAGDSSECGCNDYSYQTANTGIKTATVANPNLIIDVAATTTYVTVYTAASGLGADGSTIKSVIIKSIPDNFPFQGSLQGMVRLFISNGKTATLYKEVPIPVVPQTPTLSLPIPQYTTFETILLGDLKLSPGFSLLATTQNAQPFNIIVEGLDWTYPNPDLVGVCCNFEQEAANTGIGTVSVANTAIDGSGTIATIFQAGATLGTGAANGSSIKTITIKALQSTHEGIVRLFVSPDGSTWTLMQEIWIPQTTQSAFEPSFKQIIAANYNLKAGYYIGASTQNAEGFAITIDAEDWIYPVI